MVCQDSKVDNFANPLVFLIIIRSGLLAGIRWSVCMLKSLRSLCLSLFWDFFYTGTSWWSFSGVRETVSLLKSPGLFWPIFWIQANLNNTVVFTYPLISKSSNPFINPLRIIPSTPGKIGITFTFRFQGFFYSLARSRYQFLFSLSFIFTQWSVGTAKPTIWQRFFLFFLLLLLTITWSGRLVEIRWSICITKSQRRFYVSFSWTDTECCI